MGFQTTLRFGTNISLQGVQSITEDGKPQQICLQGLQSATTYYAMADLLEDGLRVAQSNKAKFTTLAAGAMSVTYSYYRRNSCNEHVVVYTYTSTYAPSSCILHAVGPDNFVANYQGIIDSSNNTVTFEIDDWDGGVNYDVYATLYDIYGEEQQSVVTTLTSGTINTISLTPTAVTETTVTLEIDKCDDCGFYVGWVDVWLGTEDPDTDPSDFHETITSSDTSITITGLTGQTSYYFRATFVCDDEHTEVTGAAVSATTTAHDYSGDNLTIKNLETTYNNKLRIGVADGEVRLFWSVNGGTWQSNWYSSSENMQDVVTMSPGDIVELRANCHGNAKPRIRATYAFEAYGNAATVSPSEDYLFYNAPNLRSAENLYTTGGKSMFESCAKLTTGPTIHQYTTKSLANMFKGCTSLVTPPQFANDFTRIVDMTHMFDGCTALTTSPNMMGITVGAKTPAASSMFKGCSLLNTVYAPSINIRDVSAGSNYVTYNWLDGVASTGVVYVSSEEIEGYYESVTDSSSSIPPNWTCVVYQ